MLVVIDVENDVVVETHSNPRMQILGGRYDAPPLEDINVSIDSRQHTMQTSIFS
jgi:hypothetical protein